MKNLLAIDFGSTFTKITAIDLVRGRITATAKAFTTIETDVSTGLNNALAILQKENGYMDFDAMIASSSAAGGLKMVSCGLVPDLTAKASRMAAASAGAKVYKTYSYELSRIEQEEIAAIAPDIVLLSGGIDGGNKEVLLRNAANLAKVKAAFYVVVAGNKTAAPEAADILEAAGKPIVLTENVMPEFGKLNIAPAKAAIKQIFIRNIIRAKGLDRIQKQLYGDITPTPLAVFEAAELLSKGTGAEKGLGQLMAYDVGGATTDVYSMADGMPSKSGVVIKGLVEPFGKRSVEGDIGVRYSMSGILEEAGAKAIAQAAGVGEEDVIHWAEVCKKDQGTVPKAGDLGKAIDQSLAAAAITISADRHCGFYEIVYTPMGETALQTGKDLTGVKYVIGAGGSVINSQDPGRVLAGAMYQADKPSLLKPASPKLLLDSKNIFAAMGLLARISPETALSIMKREFVEI